MAYQADILINVRGFQDLARIQKALEGTAYKIDQVNTAAARMGEPVKNIERFTRQLELADKALQKVAIGSPQEQRAISNYVTVLNNSNVARERQNKLIQAEVNARNAATNAIRANVEANIAESKATRAARDEAQRLNKELVDQERLRRKLAERGLMPLSTGGIAKGVENAGFGPQGPALPPVKAPTGLQAPGVMDAILGGAFPALFGGGPGAMIGGAAGGFIGGKMGGLGGMALSIAFSAIGQQLDEAIKKVKELGDAINMVDVDKLRDSFVYVNSELEVAITRSIRLGDIENARALAAEAAAQQTGALGTAIQDSANATTLLSNSWTKVQGSVSTLLSIVGAPFAAALSGLLEIVNLVAVGWNKVFSLVGATIKGVGEFVIKLFGGEQALKAVQGLFEAITESQQRADAAAQLKLDKLKEETMIANALFNLEAKRTQGTTAEQQLQNVDISLRQKKLELIQQLWNTEERVREENKGASQEKIDALVKEEQKRTAINIKQAELNASREREKIINNELLAQDRLRIEALQIQSSVLQANAQTTQTLISIKQSELEQQQQFALSLNEEVAKINQIAALKQQSAELTYQNTLREQELKVQIAALELQSVEAAYKRGFATEQAVEKSQLLYSASVQIRDAVLQGAAAEREHVKATADLERRKQTVAAYASDYARQTEEATQALNAQQSALQNQAQLTQTIAQAQQTINNLQIDQLQTQLQNTNSVQGRYDILYKIRDLEIANARLVLDSTRAQITAELERQRVVTDIAYVKMQELKAVVQMAAAQNVLTKAHLDALKAQERAFVVASKSYEIARKQADVQWRTADAIFKASVSAASLRVQTEGAAVAAGDYAGNMERAAGAILRSTETVSGNMSYGQQFGAAGQNAAFMAEYAAARNKLSQQTISGPGQTLTVQAAERAWQRLNASFMVRAEEYNRRVAAERSSRAVEDWQRYTGQTAGTPEMLSAIARYSPSANSPQVNITTGPVMQMNGTNYVTMTDLQQATSTAARQGANMALSQLQNNPSVRRSIGVAR